jgi:UDP-N-acetyl-2-amino-2-deoxyglucuronate dehydrogenase
MLKVGVIGCGAILRRHVDAINSNEGFELVSLCDVQEDILRDATTRYDSRGYKDYQIMLASEKLDLAVIATPNGLHTEQSLFCLEEGCDVLIEKPVSLSPKDVLTIQEVAKQNKRRAYCVLQVRLNPAVQVLRRTIDKKLLGNIRGISLIQRWQRPIEYFTGWRAIPNIGGGTLYECGIHYIDIMGYILGYPEVIKSSVYSVKHKHTEIEDTIYSLFDFGDFGGTMEVTIAAEPFNLECSISILGSNGYIKLGGKAMNVIESYNFLSNGCRVEFENMLRSSGIPNKPNSYGSYAGSCPNHAELYAALPDFKVGEAYGSIKLIDEIYKKSNSGVGYCK